MLLETFGKNILISPQVLKMPHQASQFARKLDLCIGKTIVIHFQLNNRSVSLREKDWKRRQGKNSASKAYPGYTPLTSFSRHKYESRRFYSVLAVQIIIKGCEIKCTTLDRSINVDFILIFSKPIRVFPRQIIKATSDTQTVQGSQFT